MTILRRINAKAVGVYTVTIIICIAIQIWVMKLWLADLHVPFIYTGDALLVSTWIKGIVDNGWYLQNNFIGAPFLGTMYDFPLSNNLDFLIIKFISIFSHDYAFSMNIYFLMTFPLSTLTSMLVLRQLKISYPISILGSLLFAFLPYHFWRGEGHLFLAAYYMIPPMITVLFWLYSDSDFLISGVNGKIRTNLLTRKSIIGILICILVSSTFIYYPFFSCFFLVIAGITSSVFHRSKVSFIAATILIALITIGVLINVSPTLMYQHENGKNPLTAIRSPQEAEIYGLKITLLLLPITNHYIPVMANIANKYISTAPLTNHNAPSLGIIIGTGFLLLIGWIFYRLSEGLKFKFKQYDELNGLSILNLSALLLGTVGAFGSIFAYAVAYLFPLSPQFRAYDRISIFIAFFSMAAIAILLETLSERYAKTNAKKILFLALLGILLIAGIMDQTGRQPYETIYALTKTEYLNDAGFINKIEEMMPSEAMIFQLPYIPYPEYGNMYKMTDYSHFKGYLHSSKLRWSYGAMKGRPEDAWQSGIASETIGDLVKMLSLAGFNGIYVDGYGYGDGGIGVIANLSSILKAEPLISKDNRLFFFDMTKYNQNKSGNLGYVQLEGWSGIQYSDGFPTRWMSNDAMTEIFTRKNQTVNMSFDAISFYRPRAIEIYSDGILAARKIVPTNFIDTNVSLNLKKGKNTLRFHVPEGCESPSAIPELKNPDPRCLSLAIRNITIDSKD